MQTDLLEMSTEPSDLMITQKGFKFVTETDANSGNLSVPGHMIQKNTFIWSDVFHTLIFIFLGMLHSPLIKSQPVVAMEPNQTWSLLL